MNGPMLVAEGPEKAKKSRGSSSPALDGLDLEALVTDPVCQRLFRLFLVFAGDNLVPSADGRLLRCVTRGQAQFLLGQIGQLRDQMQICPDRSLPSVHSEEDAQLGGGNARQFGQLEFSSDKVTFRELLGQALTLCPRRFQFAPLVDRLFARYVLQIVRKGFLLCRRVRPFSRALRPFSCCLTAPSAECRPESPAGRMAALHRHSNSGCFSSLCRPSAGRWRPFWCVLMPGQLQLWPLSTDKSSSRRRTPLTRLPAEAELEVQSNRRNDCSGDGRRCWTLSLQRDTQMEPSELGQLFGWFLATRSALVELAHVDQLQRQLWIADLEMVVRKRRPSLLLQFDRLNSTRPMAVAELRRSPSVGKQLLQKENRALVELLEAERRALRDEETVRQLATRMLDEEVQRADSLRQTVQHLTQELETERQQRMLLEGRLFVQRPSPSPTPMPGLEATDAEEQPQLFKQTPELYIAAPERLVTPQPRARKAKRLRDSIRNKKKAMEVRGSSGGGGEELKVVRVEAAKKEEEEEAHNHQREEDQMNGPEFYEQATLRATDLWEATKTRQQPNGISAAEANLLMAMSTRSV